MAPPLLAPRLQERIVLILAALFVVATPARPHCLGDVPSDSLRRTPIVEAVQQAIPAVVNIHGQKTVDAHDGMEGARRVNGMGTGVIIDPRGYILTNYHVIDGVRPIQVTLQDNRTYNAQLVARDSHTDLAVIRMRTNESMKLIRIGTSSDLMPGETVIAVGNAYGYHHTVTKGIISSLQRTVEVTDSQRYYDLIQTDASINPGNSGGPLLNVDGEMIGINVAVRVGADGIAFAIPVDRAMEVAAALLSAEQSGGGWHGLVGRSEVNDREWRYTVDRVAAGSPAEECGLRSGDRVVRIGDTTIRRQLDVERAFLGVPPGSPIEMEVVRSDKTMPIRLVVADVTETPNVAPRTVWTRLGVRLAPLPASELPTAASRFRGGLRVTAVRNGGPADRHGLRTGDVLVGMMDWETTSLSDVDYILNHMDPLNEGTVPFYFIRDRETRVGQLSLTRR